MKAVATFAMNCFWGPQKFFSGLPGVLETVVGYSGGTKANPTYTDLGDHTETIQITFDPERISFEQLLGRFFNEHDASDEQKTQYKSIIFYHNEGQRALAEKAKARWEKSSGKKALTEIKPAETFYPAEEYHQHYLKKATGAPRG